MKVPLDVASSEASRAAILVLLELVTDATDAMDEEEMEVEFNEMGNYSDQDIAYMLSVRLRVDVVGTEHPR